MSFAETAELAVRLTLKDGLTGPLRSATGAIGNFEQRTGLLSKGVRNLADNAMRLGVVGFGLLTTQVKFGLDSLRELENVMAQTEAVIASTGGVAGLSADQIRAMAVELENLTTVDDKAIQSAQNLLLTFKEVGADIFPEATLAVINLSTAMGQDLDQAAVQVGKALNDPISGLTALRRVGIQFTDAQEAQIKSLVRANDLLGAQSIILEELESQFGGSAARAANTFDGRMRRIGDAVEDAQMALATGFLPVIEKVADRLGSFVSDPANLDRIARFGETLAGALDGLVEIGSNLPWGAIGSAMELAGTGARAILGAFTAMPPWVQTAVLTGWGLNKLTGGALSGIVGELGKGLIKGVLGMNAGVVNINAGTVNGMPGTPGAGGGAGALGTVAALGGGVAVAGLAREVQQGISGAIAGGNADTERVLNRNFDLQRSLFLGPFNTLLELPTHFGRLGDAITGRDANSPLLSETERQSAILADGNTDQRRTLDATQRGGRLTVSTLNSQTRAIVSAIYANRPIINSTTINRTTTITDRYGPSGDSGTTPRLGLTPR